MQYAGTRFDSFVSRLEQGLMLDKFKHILLIFSTEKAQTKISGKKNTGKKYNWYKCQFLFCSAKNHTNAEALEGLADFSNPLWHLQSQFLSKNYPFGKEKQSRAVQ